MSIVAALNVVRKYASGGAITASPAQVRVGNYKMRHITFQGIPISIENPKGTIRSGIDSNGKPWANRMAADYGYIKRTEGKDGDQVDAFVGPYRNSNKVFIIDQLHHHKEKFDEHKCLLGFNTKKQALTAYHHSYGRVYGHHHTVGAVTELSVDAFKEWLKGGGGKEPVAPDVPKYQTGGAVPEEQPIEDVPGVGPVPTETYPELTKIPVGLVREQAEFVAQPRERMKAQIPQMPETGQWTEEQEYLRRAGIAQQAEKEAEFGRQASLATVGTGAFGAQAGALGIAGGKLAVKPHAANIGKTAFDLHPDEVASALQTSGTKGTSAGGIFTGFSDGKDRYVKIAKSLDHAKEEVLASKLYELAGVRAAKTELTQLNGKPAVASQIIPKASQLSEFVPEQYNSINGLKEDFPAHAWLANWDAPGVGSENPLGNIMVAPIGGGQWGAHYVDFGGALRFRGLGGEKGDLFGPKVTETKLMLGPTAKNPLVASVFEDHQIGPDNPVAQRIANISNQQISDLVHTYGPSSPDERVSLFSKLTKRRDDLAKQYGLTPGTSYHFTPPQFSEFDVPGGGRYSFKNPEKDANQLLSNHQYGETYNPPGGINPANYDAEGIAHDMYKMAEKNPEYVDQVYKKLPFELQEDVNIKLSQKIQREGDPWAEEAKPKAPPTGGAPTGIGHTYKLMQLNKTHNVDDIVNSIKAYHESEVNVGKTVTEKQKGKITYMITKAPAHEIADAIKNLSPEEQKNVFSWLPAAKVSNVKTMGKVVPEKAAQPIPDIDKINKSHSLYQILGAIKNYSPLQSEVPYHAYQDIPKQISKFSPAEIMGEMEPLSLTQKQKVMEWLPESTKEKMAQLGVEKSIKKQGFIGQEYYDALEPIDWSKYQPKKATSARHQFSKTMLQHILGLGFNPDVTLYKGGKHLTYPQTLLDPVTEPHRLANPEERAFFMSHDPQIASAYSLSSAHTPTEYIARPTKTFAVSWKDLTGTEDYSSYHMKKLIEAAREKGADLLVVNDIADVGSYGHGLQTQYAFLNTHVLRGPGAKFDVDKLHMRWPLAGLVGGGLFGYGTLKGQEREGKMARGGAAKATKETANYRLGTKAEHCAICTMFRAPDSCTSVQGKIRRQDTCDYFEKIKGMARGGQTRTYTMPLKKGSSKATISQNIREFHTGPTFAHTAAKFGKERARKQAIAVALSSARKYGKGKAMGGPNIESMIMRGSSIGMAREGMIHSTIPGRTDKLPMNVRAGSYVLPADIPSALGQGNTMAGGEILKKMFSSGPYGIAAPHIRSGRGAPRMTMRIPRMRQDGGEAEGGDGHVPIIAAGGEYILHPDVVRDIGHGKIDAGHRVLDKFVINVRKQYTNTLKKLPPPKK